MSFKDLVRKYDVPIPRYTSYPTVPYWEGLPTTEQWLAHVAQAVSPENSQWSMYMHIPFCESLCTFCGCNNIISRNHKLEDPYVNKLLKEWSLYRQAVPGLLERPLKHIHLGGGTPTFLRPEALAQLFDGVLAPLKKTEDLEASIEVDPRRTTVDHLRVLREYGFNRISMGVQDFEPEVQRLINRLQPFEITRDLTEESRRLGFESVNFDLIYGLARQTPETMMKTVELTIQLRPDRIALYSFALVPWIKPAQRLFKDEDLPSGEEKRRLYEIAREKLLQSGYLEIGMDHFALPTDNLASAMKNGTLHRNFMGYTDQNSELLLALGVSGISQTPWSFHQNEKLLPKYEESLNADKIPTLRGHLMTDLDRSRQRQILDLMTRAQAKLVDEPQVREAREFLAEMQNDGLVELKEDILYLTEKGRPFMRNVCAFFDERLKANKPELQIFSRSL